MSARENGLEEAGQAGRRARRGLGGRGVDGFGDRERARTGSPQDRRRTDAEEQRAFTLELGQLGYERIGRGAGGVLAGTHLAGAEDRGAEQLAHTSPRVRLTHRPSTKALSGVKLAPFHSAATLSG